MLWEVDTQYWRLRKIWNYSVGKDRDDLLKINPVRSETINAECKTRLFFQLHGNKWTSCKCLISFIDKSIYIVTVIHEELPMTHAEFEKRPKIVLYIKSIAYGQEKLRIVITGISKSRQK